MDLEKIGGVTLDYRYFDGQDFYNEGDEVENMVLGTFVNHRNPIEIIKQDNRWPILYQLSPQRQNIVCPMDVRSDDVVLEVGAGMGALTGSIAKRCAYVDCVELSKRRSLANAYRNKEYNNIHIYVGNFSNIQYEKKYDVVTLIGVLEYAPSYIHSKENPALAFLKAIHNIMQASGRLYIAIENKLGMKYFAGCREDHLGKSFAGIEGYKKNDFARTFTKSEIEEMLISAGFDNLYFYYPYPDYKLPSVIYSDDMPYGDFIPGVANYDNSRLQVFNERKAMLNLQRTKEFSIFANSFLIEAVKQ